MNRMKLIETRWWSLPIGDEWHYEMDGDTVIISDADGVGSLEFTVLEVDGDAYCQGALDELAAELVPGAETSPVQCGDWRGNYASHVEDGASCRDWLLGCRQWVLLVSYTCALEHRGMDDAAVDQMLAELQTPPGGA